MLKNNANLERQVNKIARMLGDHRRRLENVEKTAQGRYRSVSDGVTVYYDSEGVARSMVGKQEDGSFTAVDINAIAPNQPSQPIIEDVPLTLNISWDGMNSIGVSSWQNDFAHVEVHVSDTPGFTPTDATQIHTFKTTKGGQVSVAADPGTYYVQFVAVNTSKTESTPSDEAEATVSELTDAELGPESVTTPKIARRAASSEKLTLGSTSPAVNLNYNMEDEATNQDTGVPLDYPAMWQFVWTDNANPMEFETVAPIQGLRSLRISSANTTDGLRVHTARSSVPGDYAWFGTSADEKWYVSARYRSSVGFTPSTPIALVFHSSTDTTVPWAVFDADAIWQSSFTSDPVVADTEYAIDGLFTVPAGHTRCSVSFAVPNSGVADEYFVLDDITLTPATVSNQIVELNTEKISTGLISASQRLVAGASLTGARAELTPAGFQAYNASNDQTFGVLSGSGDMWIGTPGGYPSIRASVAVTPFTGVSAWTVQQYFVAPGWDPGQIWGSAAASEVGDDGVTDAYAKLFITSPFVTGDETRAAFLSLKSSGSGVSQAYLRASYTTISASTMNFVSSAGSMDFNLGFTNTWSFRNAGDQRVDIEYNFGSNSIKSKLSSSAYPLKFHATDYQFVNNSSYDEIYITKSTSNARAIISSSNTFASLAFIGDRIRVSTWDATVEQPIQASVFMPPSDASYKTNEVEVTDGLATLKSLTVYDYDTPHGAAEDSESHRAFVAEATHDELESFRFRQRGVMAQDLKKTVPHAVSKDDVGLSVDLYGLLATTIAAVKELTSKVDALEKEVK